MNTDKLEFGNDNNGNNGKNQQTAQSKGKKIIDNVVGMDARNAITYDIPLINRFLDTVFHTELDQHEYIIGWAQKSKTPSFPTDIDKMLKKLSVSKAARVCYVGTSSVVPDIENELRNRKSQFKRLHVVVLDDIGTKVSADKLPEDLIPNYIIESSKGNFQYGFILETPIEDYDLAEALVHLVYTSGYGDEGGKMPCKPVRLPCGINGRKGEEGDFEVRLIELNTDYWTPNELIEVLDVGVSWDEVEKDIDVAKQGKSAKFAGTSLWSSVKPVAASFNGIVDPVLEWMYENNLVMNDNGGDWVDVVCPWSDEHSDDNITAGYSPLGRGGDNANSRGFHCFHGHCADNKTPEFLTHIAEVARIDAPIIDNSAELIADYAFSISDNAAVRVRGVDKPIAVKMDGFRNAHPRKVAVYDAKGKEKLIAENTLWVTAPNRLTVQGMRHDPSSRDRIVEYDGLRYINTYAEPQWGKGKAHDYDVKMFNEFLSYLIPREEELSYFTQWLAAKAQDPTFKGAGILMVAPAQGTGRTTLTDMITTLFTPNNVKKVSFQQLCGATESGAFNDWLEAGIVTCDEIISNGNSKYKVYETLKDLLDPRPKSMVINAKYGAQRSTVLYTSYLLLTNHSDAIGAMGGDRRAYVIQNTLNPETPEFFDRLNEWLNIKDDSGMPRWARSVWRWLHTLTPDVLMLNSPAPSTEAKEEMIQSTKSRPDIMVEVLMDYFKGSIPMKLIEGMARDMFDRTDPKDSLTKAYTVTSLIKKVSQATMTRGTINNDRVRIRVSNSLLREQGINNLNDHAKVSINDLLVNNINDVKEELESDYDNLITKLNDRIDDLLS